MIKLPISVCIIAGNEAHRIRSTLESVAAWTQEIIIVLNEDVNDGTDKIAAEFGAKVFREPWKGFGPQKNSAVAKATQVWLLNLDADEVIPLALREEIQEVVSKPGNHTAFCFPRLTQFCGRWIRHGDWYPDRVVRLWRCGSAYWTGEEPHAHLEVTGQIGRLRSDLLHYSMESLNHHVRKTMGYSDIFARRQTGRKIGVLELWFRPWWRFVRSYVLRCGFLDSWQGYVIARMVAFESFLRYAKVREAQLSQTGNPNPPSFLKENGRA